MMLSSKKSFLMKPFSLLIAVLVLGVTLFAADAEAKRLGGSRSFGMQRSTAVNRSPSTQNPSVQKTPAAPAAANTATAGAPAAPRRSWMGPLAGLAAGLGLAALASHLGFGEGFANVLMIALLAMAAVALIGFVMRKRTAPSTSGMAYAGAMGSSSIPQHQPAFPARAGGSLIGSALAGNAQSAARPWPADFDAEAFVRSAKVNFIRMQAANDEGNLDDLRQFTTPEMFAELRMDLAERKGVAQHTEVVRLDAEVLEVVEEASRYIASVHFHGLIREDRQDVAEFSEVWHLIKPVQDNTWIIAGIQQTQ